jgi:hypothetical protein
MTRMCEAPLRATSSRIRAVQRRWRRRLAALGSVGGALWPTLAQAEPSAPNESICIEWPEAELPSCPTRSEVVAKVEEVLGRPSRDTAPCNRIVKGSIAPNARGAGWVARLGLEAADRATLGQRELSSENPSCHALLEPVALVIALMLESAKDYVSLRVAPEPVVAPPAIDGQPRLLRASAAIGFVSGFLDSVALGPELGFGTPLAERWSLHLHGNGWFPTSSASGRAGRFWGALAGASFCFDSSQRGPRAAACVSSSAGVLHGSGSGLDYELSTSRPYAQAALQLIGVLPVRRGFALFAQFGAGVPFIRPRFVYVDADGAGQQLHRPAAVVAFGAVGVEITAPSAEPGGSSR